MSTDTRVDRRDCPTIQGHDAQRLVNRRGTVTPFDGGATVAIDGIPVGVVVIVPDGWQARRPGWTGDVRPRRHGAVRNLLMGFPRGWFDRDGWEHRQVPEAVRR